MTLPAAVIQYEPVLGDLDATLSRLDPLLARCRDARLVVLPELCNSGYALPSREAALAASEPVTGGPFLDHLVAHARETGSHVVSGIAERDGDTLFNSAVCIGADGVVGTYRKLHLFDREKLIFEPGDAPPRVLDLGDVRVGMLVCFDWTFPEVWRLLAIQGADVVAHPSNLVLPGRCQRAVPVHAMINRYYIATANRTGSEADLTFTGRSLVAAPDGTVLAEASPNGAAVLRFAIDVTKTRDKQVTGRNDLLADRRPETYGALAQRRASDD